MNTIDPKDIRYIKLGAGGSWVQPSFEWGEIHFGYKSVPHALCQRGDWDAVVKFLGDEGRSPAKAKDAAREIRDFYTLDVGFLDHRHQGLLGGAARFQEERQVTALGPAWGSAG